MLPQPCSPHWISADSMLEVWVTLNLHHTASCSRHLDLRPHMRLLHWDAPETEAPSLDVQVKVQQQQQHRPGLTRVRSNSGGLPVQRAPKGTGRVLDGQGLQQVLSQAWDPMSDVGPQVAALHQLFGDALLPLIPGLP